MYITTNKGQLSWPTDSYQRVIGYKTFTKFQKTRPELKLSKIKFRLKVFIVRWNSWGSSIKIISVTYKSLQFKQPSSILDLLKIQPTHSTHSSSVLPIHLGSKLLTDPSTTKLLLSGIHCPNIYVLFLQHHLLKPTTLSSHCLPLNSTNN